MNKVLLFVTFIGLTAFLACKNAPNANSTDPNAPTGPVEHANPTNLAGHWIAIDFCSRAASRNSILKAMNTEGAHMPYAYAFTFNPEQMDSVTCYNGVETYKLAARVNLDTIELKDARQGRSVFLVYLPQTKEMELFDATTGSAHIDRLIKSSSDAPGGENAFAVALNHHLFEGNYAPVDKKVDIFTQFTPTGYITNFPGYDRYKPCIGGDCFLLSDQMDVMTVANSKDPNSLKMFGFRFSTAGDTLTLYNMNVSATEKAATLGNVAYRFTRKKVAENAAPKPAQQPQQPNNGK